ncbi:MAG: response regulator [Armatimonadota bacterium]
MPQTVLVVEDEPLTRAALRQLVEQSGGVPALATDGGEALSWLASHPLPRLILLDLVMPGMGGEEVLAQLGSHPEWSRIPIVVISGTRLTLSSPQVCEVILKPFLPEDVRRAIRAHGIDPVSEEAPHSHPCRTARGAAPERRGRRR